MAHELLIVTPDNQTRRVSIEGERLSVGRAHNNDLCYPEDASLSRRHFVIECAGDELWVEDLGSKNGTLVNGNRVNARQELRPGDRLVAGHLEITLIDPEAEATGNVVFVPEGGPEQEPEGTVMTRLSDLLSSEATAPGHPLMPGPASAPSPTPAKSFDNSVVQLLLRAGNELSVHRPLEELFPMILELSIEVVGAERGVLMTLEGTKLVGQAVHGDGFRISTTVRDKVIEEKASLLVRDMQQEEAFRERLSISAQQIHTMMAVPLQTEDRVIGLIYVDSRSWVREFTSDDLNLLTFLGNVAANRIEQERLGQIERENEQAAEMQRRILPGDAPRMTGIDLAGFNAPCRAAGGDYYDFIPYPDGRMGVALADVAGKGMSAAMMMMTLQPLVRMLADEPVDLGQFMSRLDRRMVAACPPNRFITMFFSVFDPSSGNLIYSNAGHNPPLLVRASGEVVQLPAGGTVLGILPELGYSEQSEKMAPGDLLAIFSDGVTESLGTNGEEYGEDRLAEELKKMGNDPAGVIVDKVLASVSDWSGAAPAEDDVTLVVLRHTA